MDFIIELGQYMIENSTELFFLTIEQILMVGYGIGLALIIGIPLGIVAAKYEKLASFIISLTSILQLIPSLAMLAILMLYFGLGFETMVIGILLYSLLPIVRNTYVGAGRLGTEIMSGISLQLDVKIYAGAIPATVG
ncbi:MAG: hypothetical protein MUO60_12075 [Clostridiaceae bacterium]|nr:hypothetical protein [Clostridiaceae bacterium]